MRKFYLWFSLASLIFLGIGTHFTSDSILLAFAATSDTAQLIRLGLIAVIAGQLVTIPPRHPALRIATGLTALLATGYGINLFFSGYSPLLDVCVYMLVGVALGISALELSDEDYNVRTARYISPVAAIPIPDKTSGAAVAS